MAAWIGPAIGAVGGIISSLFGGKKKTENRVNYKQMVADAEAAGFNPLTVLRNGGSAGYMQTVHPGLSSGEMIGSALGHVGSFLADFDPYADQKKELESRLVEAQIANLNASTGTMFPPAPGKPGSFNVPTWAAANTEQRPSRTAGRLSSSGSVNLPVIGPDVPAKPEQDEIVSPFPVGSGIEIPGHIKSADAWEGMFSDPGGWIGGLYNAGAIYNHNMKRLIPALSDEWRERGKRVTASMNKRAKQREEKLRREAAKNARNLGFPGY